MFLPLYWAQRANRGQALGHCLQAAGSGLTRPDSPGEPDCGTGSPTSRKPLVPCELARSVSLEVARALGNYSCSYMRPVGAQRRVKGMRSLRPLSPHTFHEAAPFVGRVSVEELAALRAEGGRQGTGEAEGRACGLAGSWIPGSVLPPPTQMDRSWGRGWALSAHMPIWAGTGLGRVQD